MFRCHIAQKPPSSRFDDAIGEIMSARRSNSLLKERQTFSIGLRSGEFPGPFLSRNKRNSKISKHVLSVIRFVSPSAIKSQKQGENFRRFEKADFYRNMSNSSKNEFFFKTIFLRASEH
jgi:hypothetical protein